MERFRSLLVRPNPMKPSLSSLALWIGLLVASPAKGGPNEGGVIILHRNQTLLYTEGASFCGESGLLPASAGDGARVQESSSGPCIPRPRSTDANALNRSGLARSADDLEADALHAVSTFLDEGTLAVLKEVIGLGYRPLAGEN